MAYLKPYIDSSGFHMPLYQDILSELINSAKTIFGNDIYLSEDSQDYQFISVMADKIYDSFLAAQLVYNNYSPRNAIGVALDSLVKINGIKRNTATNTVYNVTLTGIEGTVIQSGVIIDNNGIKWDLPSVITLGSGSTASTIMCETAGAIAIGTTLTIGTPKYGWNGITLGSLVSSGTDVETDSALRARQTISTAISSKTILDGINGAISSLAGVTRLALYENDTDSIDSSNMPPHSITCVVEGGNNQDIGNTLYLKKTPGCATNGDVVITVTDSNGNDILDAFNNPITKRFYRPAYVDIDVVVNVKALSIYTDKNTTDIKSSVSDYLNSLKIGTSLLLSSVWWAALSSMKDLKNPAFSILSLTAARHGQTQGTTDIEISYKEVTRGNIANVTVNVT